MQAELPPPPPEDASVEECLKYYEEMDLDEDGIPDWTSRVDGRISTVLYPNDNDMDGDGIENVLDLAPLNRDAPGVKGHPEALPSHLRMWGEVGRLQSQLFHRYRIIAINHTDQHAPGVLRAFLLILEKGLPEHLSKPMENQSVRYLYAFKGHDAHVNIAAYHKQMRALSIGGVESYGRGPLSETVRLQVLATLAHEMGHAFLFDHVSALELSEISRLYGSWGKSMPPHEPTDLLDPVFFQPHPWRKEMQEALQKMRRRFKQIGKSLVESLSFVKKDEWRSANLTSQYATTNTHEWFADAFAAQILNRLGERGELGSNWKERLVKPPDVGGAYWVNYNNISEEFRDWFKRRLLPPVPTLHQKK